MHYTHGHWRLHTRPHVLTTKIDTLSAQTHENREQNQPATHDELLLELLELLDEDELEDDELDEEVHSRFTC
jgi:hypothetical protein